MTTTAPLPLPTGARVAVVAPAAAIALALGVAAVALAPTLPGRIAVHFAADGTPDGWGSPWVMLAVAVGRPVLVAAAVSGLSALIELVQASVPAIGRSCDTNDWFMNTIGAVLAAFLAALILRGEKRRGRRRMSR